MAARAVVAREEVVMEVEKEVAMAAATAVEDLVAVVMVAGMVGAATVGVREATVAVWGKPGWRTSLHRSLLPGPRPSLCGHNQSSTPSERG